MSNPLPSWTSTTCWPASMRLLAAWPCGRARVRSWAPGGRSCACACGGPRLRKARAGAAGAPVGSLAVLDERVRAAVVSGYFNGCRDGLLRLRQNCSCNYSPGLWEPAHVGDTGALVAPRALFLETGDRDPLNGKRGVANVEEQVAVTRQAYALEGVPDRPQRHVFAGERPWLRRAALPVAAGPAGRGVVGRHESLTASDGAAGERAYLSARP